MPPVARRAARDFFQHIGVAADILDHVVLVRDVFGGATILAGGLGRCGGGFAVLALGGGRGFRLIALRGVIGGTLAGFDAVAGGDGRQLFGLRRFVRLIAIVIARAVVAITVLILRVSRVFGGFSSAGRVVSRSVTRRSLRGVNSLFGAKFAAFDHIAIGTPCAAMAVPLTAAAAIVVIVVVALRARVGLDQCLPVGDRDLVIVRVDFRKGEEAVPVSAVIDERRLQRRLDPRDFR